MTILVTGGAGFIGANLVRYLVSKKREVVVFDNLTYAGNLANLEDLDPDLATFVKGDVADPKDIRNVFKAHKPESVLHLAAESHVDRSIVAPGEFIRTNVMGAQVILDAARDFDVKKFVHVSTDEVYGSLGEEGLFTEQNNLAPNSPYSASKASSDLLVRAYYKTFGLPACITRCSNNYGPYQFPEKLIPLFSTNAMEGKPLPIYGQGKNIRDWIYVLDHCRALVAVMDNGKPGQIYNIGADCEKSNMEITRTILKILGKPESLIEYVRDRPAHDFRYAIDSGKIRRELGWTPKMDFEAGLEATVGWYQENREWWESIKSGEYRNYYKKMYGGRLKD